MDKLTYEQAGGKYGTVTMDGVEYALTEQAHCDNYGTDGAVRYYANAIDIDGNEYQVTWDTTAEYDQAQADYREMQSLEEADSRGEGIDEDRLEELHSRVSEAWVEDESNSCDWDNPISVETID